MPIDLPWRDAVKTACDPVFLGADVGFVWNESVSFEGPGPALLWEADPLRFAERYPDSGIEESYGTGWPAPCIDYWIYVDPAAMTARLSWEGFDIGEEVIALTGFGSTDGAAIAARFAEILR